MKLSPNLKILATACAVGLAALSSTQAATISWSNSVAATEGAFLGDLSAGLFDTSGTFISAENTGGGATSFDGINFSAGVTTFAGGTTNVFHLNGPSQTATYGTTGADTVSLSSLTIGNTYRIQALVFDGRGDPGIPGRTVEFDGISQGQYANGDPGVDYGTGLLVTGTFVADATTQDFTIEAFDGGTSKGGQLNALTLYQTAAVPEPSSTALLGLGGLALLMRRRK